MKTKLLSLILLLATVILCNPAKAQTVTLTYYGDSSSVYCSPPVSTYFWCNVYVTGYNVTDSITLSINFGDGSDSSWKSPIYYNNYVYGWIQHTYEISGFFSTQLIATGPDGTADTVQVEDDIFIGQSCGNMEGRIYMDNNNDCVYNGGDSPLTYAVVQAVSTSGDPFYNYAATDMNGNYSVNVPNGLNYDISLMGMDDLYGYTCPASGTYPDQDVPSSGLDFALHCLPGFDLSGSLWGWGFIPGASNSYINVNAYNLRCGSVTGVLKVVLNPLVTFSSASITPSSVSGDTLIWDPFTFDQINYNNWWGIDIIIPTSASAQLGDTVCFTMILEPIEGDSVPENNVQTLCYVVKSSWDPNLKDVSPRGNITNDQELNYTVVFQNTGTATASNIYILDTFDVNMDISTFKFTGSSHPCDVSFADNVVRFYFHNINLPDSNSNEPESHGWVTYSMNALPNLELGTHIQNTAAIYFDFNDPVITNTVENIISGATLVVNVPESEASSLYPNPAANTVVLELPGSCNQSIITLLNVEGKLLKSWKSARCTTSIDVSSIPEGVYFVKVKSEGHVSTSKLVVAR